MTRLSQGLQCKACNCPLSTHDDPELCSVCMQVVMDCNADLDIPDSKFVEEMEQDNGTAE